jgi:PAS domain S-box-containing protein
MLGCLLAITGTQIYWDGNPATSIAGALGLIVFISMAMVLLDRRHRWLALLAAALTSAAMHVLWVAGNLPVPPSRSLRSEVVFSIVVWCAAGSIVAAVISSTMEALRNHSRMLRENISDQHKVESALREQTATLRALLNAPLETVALLAPDGELLNINESGAQRLGATPGELTGRNVYAILPPDLARSRKELIDQVFQTGEPVRFEDSRGGRHFANSVYPVFDERGGSVLSVAIFASDITEPKRAEQELAKTLAELRRSNAELEGFNRVAVGRELRMIELKNQVNELSEQLGREPPFDVSLS